MNLRARPLRWPVLAALLLFATGCAVLASRELDTKYGTPAAKEFTSASSAPVAYERDIRPLMENRCLVCHGCYDAPCQLKLDSFEGMLRGGSKERVYHSARLTPAATSRLFEDAQTTAQWRERGFH
ncbi:MAG TPA: hypothetical protein VIU34_37030, partial [Steroidobacter sp.]